MLRLLRGKPEIDEETGGATIVAYEVAHQGVYHVIVGGNHRYIVKYYSNYW